jgi:hypothetical protein
VPTYVVFNRSTGEIVHVHFEPAGIGSSPEDVLRLVETELDRATLEVLPVAEDVAHGAQALRVEPRERRIVSAPVAEAVNSGGGLAVAIESELLLPSIRTEYTSER